MFLEIGHDWSASIDTQGLKRLFFNSQPLMQNNIFEQIKHINEYGSEYWSARELCKTLGYGEYHKFTSVIEKAKEACKNSLQAVPDHFAHVSDMVLIGSGAERPIDDYSLSRYACYLIAQNGDPRKEEIALAQTYFAFQTRKQEVQDELLEESKRVALRGEMTVHNKKLAKAHKKQASHITQTFKMRDTWVSMEI